MFNTYNEMKEIFKEVGFSDFYKSNISNNKYEVDYGPKSGVIYFNSFIDASNKYLYPKKNPYKVKIDQQLNTINEYEENVNNNNIILDCIEVFDWGGVQTSNIINAITLYRESNLSAYLVQCKEWFEDDETLKIGIDNPIWSSGWTKVYSFMFDKTAIYDSRSAAFINYILLMLFNNVDNLEYKKKIKKITNMLISFGGNGTRNRYMNEKNRKLLGVKGKSTVASRNMVSNKVASWVMRYISEIEYMSEDISQQQFRNVDKALFMLGFDISQINYENNF